MYVIPTDSNITNQVIVKNTLEEKCPSAGAGLHHHYTYITAEHWYNPVAAAKEGNNLEAECKWRCTERWWWSCTWKIHVKDTCNIHVLQTKNLLLIKTSLLTHLKKTLQYSARSGCTCINTHIHFLWQRLHNSRISWTFRENRTDTAKHTQRRRAPPYIHSLETCLH